MGYTFTFLSDELMWVTLDNFLSGEEGIAFHDELSRYVEDSVYTLYVIMDIREGTSNDVTALHRLTELESHPGLGGVVILVSESSYTALTTFFSKFNQESGQMLATTRLNEAVDFLEQLKPDITAGINFPV